MHFQFKIQNEGFQKMKEMIFAFQKITAKRTHELALLLTALGLFTLVSYHLVNNSKNPDTYINKKRDDQIPGIIFL